MGHIPNTINGFTGRKWSGADLLLVAAQKRDPLQLSAYSGACRPPIPMHV